MFVTVTRNFVPPAVTTAFVGTKSGAGAGVAVALGTDVNPGTGLSPSIPFAMALACFAMEMTLEESLIAATLNAAWSRP